MLDNFLENKKRTLWLLIGAVAFISLLIFILNIFTNSSFSLMGDSFYQYQGFTVSAIERIKNNSFSIFNYNNLFGNSIFADTYYVSYNLEFLILLLCSYVMDIKILFGIFTFLKAGVGAILFYVLLTNVFKIKSKTSLLYSLIWAVSGYACSYCLYPTFYNVLVYFPLFILIYHLENKRNGWIISLFSAYLIFSNFYVAYILFIGLMIYILFDKMVIDEKPLKNKIKNAFLSCLYYGLFIIIGVLISSCLLIPSASYLLNNSTTQRETSSVFVFEWTKYFYLIHSLFKIPINGLLNANSNYIYTEGMLYIGIIPCILLFIPFCKTNNSFYKKCRYWLIFSLILLLVPLFSMVFSGSSAPYSRWYFIIIFVNLIISAKVFDFENQEINEYENLFTIIPVIGLALNIMFLGFIIFDIFAFVSGSELLSFITIFISLILLIYVLLKRNSFESIRKFLVLETIIMVSIYFCSVIGFVDDTSIIYNNVDTIESFLDDSNIEGEKIYISSSTNVINNKTLYADYIVNDYKYFHSFYPTKSNEYFKIFSNQQMNSIHWSKKLNDGNIFTSTFMGYDYFLTENVYDTFKNVPYYEVVNKNEKYTLYKIKSEYDINDFFVYTSDSNYSSIDSNSYLEKQVSMLFSNYNPESNNDYIDANFDVEINNEFEYIEQINLKGEIYYKYKIIDCKTPDELSLYQVFVDGENIGKIVIEFEDGSLSNPCDHFGYSSSKPMYLYLGEQTLNPVGLLSSKNTTISLQSTSVSVFEKIVEEQKQYEKTMNICGDNIYLKAISKTKEEAYIVLPIQYYKEWTKIKGEFEIIETNGCFLTIKVLDISNIELQIKYINNKLEIGIVFSVLGIIILISSIPIQVYLNKRKDKKEFVKSFDYIT